MYLPVDEMPSAQAIQLRLLEIGKTGYIQAQDIVDYIAKPKVQEKLAGKACTTIHHHTACCWLKKLNWQYTQKKNRMYVDGHECKDVIQYWNEFIDWWKEYKKRFLKFDNDGNQINQLVGFPVAQIGHFWIILVTHDESTIYANDCRKTEWIHTSQTAVAEAKGEGQSIMASEFCVPEWGRLCNGDEWAHYWLMSFKIKLTVTKSRNAWVMFRAGKNQDGWFLSEDLLLQVDATKSMP